VRLDYVDSAEVITSVSGRLSTHDGIVVAHLFEDYLNRSTEAPSRLAAKGSSFDQQYFKPAKYLTHLVGELDQNSLKRIDDSRVKDPKRDVKLKLEIGVKTLESVALIDQLREIDSKTLIPGKTITVPRFQGGEVQANMIVRAWYDNNFQSDKNTGWDLSGNGNPTFLQFKIWKTEISYRIPATDWISDYAPKFGLGHHVVVELPAKDGPLFRDTSAYLTKAVEAFGRWIPRASSAIAEKLEHFWTKQSRTSTERTLLLTVRSGGELTVDSAIGHPSTCILRFEEEVQTR